MPDRSPTPEVRRGQIWRRTATGQCYAWVYGGSVARKWFWGPWALQRALRWARSDR